LLIAAQSHERFCREAGLFESQLQFQGTLESKELQIDDLNVHAIA
jgi:hypothetical protein